MPLLSRKYFPWMIAIALIVVTFFIGNFRIVVLQNERDSSSANIRRMENKVADLNKKIKNDEAYSDGICRATALRSRREVKERFSDISDSQVIRVRVVRVPYGKTRERIVADPRSNALELALLASPYSAENSGQKRR